MLPCIASRVDLRILGLRMALGNWTDRRWPACRTFPQSGSVGERMDGPDVISGCNLRSLSSYIRPAVYIQPFSSIASSGPSSENGQNRSFMPDHRMETLLLTILGSPPYSDQTRIRIRSSSWTSGALTGLGGRRGYISTRDILGRWARL